MYTKTGTINFSNPPVLSYQSEKICQLIKPKEIPLVSFRFLKTKLAVPICRQSIPRERSTFYPFIRQSQPSSSHRLSSADDMTILKMTVSSVQGVTALAERMKKYILEELGA